MRNSITIANAMIKSWTRNRVILILLILFLSSSMISIYVGSSTIRTELAAFDLAQQLQGAGNTANLPERPSISAMMVMKNSIDYVLMIGALLAIFLGFDSISKDYQDKTIHIILTRGVFRDNYLSGKILGGFLVILLLHGAAFIIELAGLGWIGAQAFGLTQAGTLLIFHLTASVYMLLFYLTAMLFSAGFLKSLPAFLTSVSVWLGSSYVIPEIARSLKTFLLTRDSSLQAVQLTEVSSPLSTAIEAISPAYHFQTIGLYLLSGDTGSVQNFPSGSVVFLLLVTAAPALILYFIFNSREVGSNE